MTDYTLNKCNLMNATFETGFQQFTLKIPPTLSLVFKVKGQAVIFTMLGEIHSSMFEFFCEVWRPLIISA